jgi:hypothetical protein
MNIEFLRTKTKTKSTTSDDVQQLLEYLKQRPTEIDSGDMTDDDIEYLKLYKLLLYKAETVQQNSISLFEWREIGESAYLKLKNIISDMESSYNRL